MISQGKAKKKKVGALEEYHHKKKKKFPGSHNLNHDPVLLPCYLVYFNTKLFQEHNLI